MKALILAAGLGTRLKPLTLTRAKPSLPVLGIPTLWYPAWHLRRSLGIREIALNLGHLPRTMEEAASDAELASSTGIQFHFSDESDGILGSSGALWKLSSWLGSRENEPILVANADSICFPDWKRLLAFHRNAKAALTLHVRAFDSKHDAYTNLDVGPAGVIRAFGKKAPRGIMFSGCYVIEPELLAEIPSGVSELRPTLLEPLAAKGRLHAYREDGPWFDTGTVGSYVDTQFELLTSCPFVRELVELKMRETAPGCWVPKTWPAQALESLGVRGPAVFSGAFERWLAVKAGGYGPRFVGVHPPSWPLSSGDELSACVVSGDIVAR